MFAYISNVCLFGVIICLLAEFVGATAVSTNDYAFKVIENGLWALLVGLLIPCTFFLFVHSRSVPEIEFKSKVTTKVTHVLIFLIILGVSSIFTFGMLCFDQHPKLFYQYEYRQTQGDKFAPNHMMVGIDDVFSSRI